MNARTLIITLLLAILVAGCASTQSRLVRADTDRIIAVARRQLKSHCPDFDQQDWAPHQVSWTKWSISETGSVSVTFASRQVRRMNPCFTNQFDGIVRASFDHRTATVAMSNEGDLLQQGVSEWSGLPEMQYIRYSEMTLHTTETNYLSNHVFEFIGTNAPKTQP